VFSVDLGSTVSVTCVKCGVARELPEPDGTSRMPAASSDGSTTLTADTPCKCGGKRVRIALDFEPKDAASGHDEPGE
jgi:hypothetical protein